HTRRSNSASGYGKASAWTSCGRASVTAPVSAGDVRTRIASGSAAMICSGRLIRSQYRDTGLKQSLTDVSWEPGDSSCCNTDAGHVAVAEDPEHSGEERLLAAVPGDLLLSQELDDRLGHRETAGLHHRTPEPRGGRAARAGPGRWRASLTAPPRAEPDGLPGG